MNKPTVQHFYTASVSKNWCRWRGKTWYNAEIFLYKEGGGYQKTEEEYCALVEGLDEQRVNRYWSKRLVDMCLFTFHEVVAMREYFRVRGRRWSDSFRATLALDYPREASKVKPSSPSNFHNWGDPDQIHFYNAPDYPLEFKLMGIGEFRGMTTEEAAEVEIVQAEIDIIDEKNGLTAEDLERERAEWAEHEAALDAEEVALHGPDVKLVKDGASLYRGGA